MNIDRYIFSFKAARGASTPLLAVQTPDPAATVRLLVDNSSKDTPAFLWDVMRGLQPVNQPAASALGAVLRDPDSGEAAPLSATTDPVDLLREFAPRLPDLAVLYLLNPQRYLSDSSASGAAYVQALWNLRDPYKADGRMVVLLGTALTLPPELSNDVLPLDEPLPGEAELRGTVTRLLASAEIPPEAALVAQAVDAVRGLASYPAEQAVAMAIRARDKTLDVPELWSRKEKMIAATPGLSVWKGGPTLEDVGGCEQVKRFIRMKADGRTPFQAVLFIDEGEKAFAGATAGTADSSGVAQGFLGTFLTQQQAWNDRGGSGMLFIGPPGAAKSMVAQAAAATFGRLTIAYDMGGMKASLVGESERRLREANKVVDAVTDGRVLTIMTCNKVVALPPELRRRFKAGTFYFDLPDREEQAVIWQKYRAKYEVPATEEEPPCDGWTGAEIRTACELHWELGIPLRETPLFIVPVAKAAAEDIESLRGQADGRFLSASRPGLYRRPDTLKPVAEALRRGRKITSAQEV